MPIMSPIYTETLSILIEEWKLKIRSLRKNEVINNPAVKTVLIGLDATIAGIEED